MATGGNFLGIPGIRMPFGMSNVNNPNPQPTPAPNPNPNFPAKQQLDPKNPQADPKANTGGTNNEPTGDPANNADPNKGQQGSQLDNFVDVFKLPVDDKGNSVTQVDPMAGPLLSVNPEKLREAASKLNFSGNIAPELLAKAASGQDPAAFSEVLNLVMQNGFLAAMQANAGVVETAFSHHTARIDKALPGRIRDNQIRNTATKHPALSHPAAQPMVESLKFSIAQTNPTLSPDRVAEMAENYVIAMATDINTSNQRNDPARLKQEADDGMDWLSLLSTPQNTGR